MTKHWMIVPQRKEPVKLRIFALPYAGGSAGAYRAWVRMSRVGIHVAGIEYPGHGMRMDEPLETDIRQLTSGVADRLEQEVDSEYAIFGHSMGATVAFELVRELSRRGARRPVHLFVSGAAAPHDHGGDSGFEMSDRGIIDRLQKLGATPRELLEHPELRNHIVNVMRADGTALGNYCPGTREPVDVPIIAFGGTDDPLVAPSALEEWRSWTTRNFQAYVHRGDHFYLFDHMERLFVTMARAAATELSRLHGVEGGMR